MIPVNEIMDALLAADGPASYTFEDGSSTPLMPLRYVPTVADAELRLPLDGDWDCMRWPFPAPEADLARLGPEGARQGVVETLAQPGVVFRWDPETDPAEVENWHRVKMSHIDPEDGALLWRRVAIPKAWAGKRVLLRFNAVYPAARFFLDGHFLGEHLSGLTPVEFDVSHLVAPGEEARLCVRLLRRHDHVDLDMPRHSMDYAGISQSAYLHAVEPVHVADYHLPTGLDDGYANGLLGGEVQVRNGGERPAAVTLTLQVADPATGASHGATANLTVPAGRSESARLALTIPEVRPWTDETPNLYLVRIRLETDGQPPRDLFYRTGFRRVEVIDERPRLNGGPLKLRGVNLLTQHPEHGLHMPLAWIRDNLLLMKKANINAVRTHYTAPPELAYLCDELGLFLIQELTIDWAAHHLEHPACLGHVLMRIEGGVRRDRHHVSLIGFSIGNENLAPHEATRDQFWAHMRLMDDLCRRLAPETWTMFPPPGPANKVAGLLETRVGDIADMHYSFQFIQSLNETGSMIQPESWEGPWSTVTREDCKAQNRWSGVWYSSEYHLMNHMPDLLEAPYASIIADRLEDPLSRKNSQQVFLDRLREEWGYMRDDPRCLGGMFFPWMCAAAGDPWGWTFWGEDADWGVVTHDLDLKPGFWALRVLYSPVLLPDRAVWTEGAASVTIPVRSLYHTRDLADCVLRTQMAAGGSFMGQMRHWKDIEIACPPGAAAMVEIPIWNEVTRKALAEGQPAVCRCALLEPDGYRPLTHDILLLPEAVAKAMEKETEVGVAGSATTAMGPASSTAGGGAIVVGPDADLADV